MIGRTEAITLDLKQDQDEATLRVVNDRRIREQIVGNVGSAVITCYETIVDDPQQLEPFDPNLTYGASGLQDPRDVRDTAVLVWRVTTADSSADEITIHVYAHDTE